MNATTKNKAKINIDQTTNSPNKTTIKIITIRSNPDTRENKGGANIMTEEEKIDLEILVGAGTIKEEIQNN
jgi:hypothetical protein